MKTTLRFLGGALGVLLIAVLCLAAYVQARGIPHYTVPTVAMHFGTTATPAQLTLGEKLVRASCAECHLNKQTNRLSGHRLLDTPPEFGTLYSANITRNHTQGIGAWTDPELVALIRTGIGRDGRYRVVMPHYVHMSDGDMAAVLAFLHSDHSWVQADSTPTPAQQPTFLLKALTHTVMKPSLLPPSPPAAPAPTAAVAYGRYLVVGRYVCYECHSKDFKTNNAQEPEKSAGYLGGGNQLLDAQNRPIRSANITFDPEHGLGRWTPAQLGAALRTGQSPHGSVRYPMPKYSTITDEEVQAIYAYLQSVPKLPHAVAAR